MKKFLSLMALSLALVLSLTACKGDNDQPDADTVDDSDITEGDILDEYEDGYWEDTAFLDYDNADQLNAEGACVEEDEEGTIITEWQEGDELVWETELPDDTVYDITYIFSRDNSFGPAEGSLILEPEDGEPIEYDLYLQNLLDDEADWDTYTEDYVELELPAGPITIRLRAGDDEHGFVNFRCIEISRFVEGEYIEPDEASGGLEDFAGWWVRPEGYECDGLSMVDFFYLDAQQGTWEVYDVYGDTTDYCNSVTTDGNGTLTFGFDFGDFDLFCDGESMFTEDDEIEYVHVEQPDFEKREDISADGKWYANGDPNTDNYFEIKGNKISYYEKDFSGTVEMKYENTWKLEKSRMQLGGDFLIDTTCIEQEFPNDTLYLCDNKKMFYWEPFFDHICFIHESMIDDPIAKTALTARQLLDNDWYSLPTYSGESGYATLKFDPAYMASGDYLENSDGSFSLPDNTWTAAASWKLLPDNQIELSFTTGETEVIDLTEDMTEVTIKTLNKTFYPSLDEARSR